MKEFRPLLAALLLALGLPSIPVAVGETLESSILDSIEANHWRTETKNVLQSFRIRSSSVMLDKEGDMKHEDLSWQWVELEPNGRRVTHMTDSTGTPLPDDVPKVQEADEDTENASDKKEDKQEVSITVGPLDPLSAEHRENHTFTRLPDPGPGLIAFRTETIDQKKGGFEATYTFETATWTPLSVSGHPFPLPDKKVKEMELTILYQPYAGQYAFPSTITSNVTAKWLLFNFRVRMEQELFDFVPREE